MRLKFDGHAIVEARSKSINFAGYYVDEASGRHDVLCRVSGEVLQTLCAMAAPTAEDLLASYSRESERINQLAAVQFAAGLKSPMIELQDIPRDWIAQASAA